MSKLAVRSPLNCYAVWTGLSFIILPFCNGEHTALTSTAVHRTTCSMSSRACCTGEPLKSPGDLLEVVGDVRSQTMIEEQYARIPCNSTIASQEGGASRIWFL
jgi:hypothetical protein